MRFLSIMGNSFGCSVSGERLMSAARDGDVQEAKALLEYNPHLARYSTSGVHNSPLHYAAARGHHEIVSLLLESDVEIDLENYRGQSALMQACYYGHWEVVQSLMLFRANVHKVDYLNGGAALHFAATNGHTRCTRLLLADYVPSIPHFWNFTSKRSPDEDSTTEFDEGSLPSILNKTADGSFTALHMAALYGHAETVHLLVSFGASVSEVTTDERTIIDPIGRRSTPLHYAASGGNAQCCQLLIAKGASLTAENSNGLTPLMVARLRERHWLEGILNKQQPECQLEILPSPYLSLPLMSIVKIARECGWRDDLDSLPRCVDPCSVCLERKCTVATKGCGHEFCTSCALYLCSTNCTSIPTPFPLGSIACPLCRRGIVSFIKLLNTDPINEMATTSTTCSSNGSSETASFSTLFCKHDIQCTQILPLRSFSLRAFICQKFPSRKLNSSPCMGAPDTSSSPAPCGNSIHPQNQMGRCSRLVLPRSASHIDGRRSVFSLNQYVTSFKLRKDQYITTDND